MVDYDQLLGDLCSSGEEKEVDTGYDSELDALFADQERELVGGSDSKEESATLPETVGVTAPDPAEVEDSSSSSEQDVSVCDPDSIPENINDDTAAEEEKPEVPVTTYGSVTPKPWQVDFIEWSTKRFIDGHNGRRIPGIILGDDMGLGKTLETIMAIAEYTKRTNTRPQDIKCLFVVPIATIEQWYMELLRVFPSELVHICHGGVMTKALASIPRRASFIVTSYGYIVSSYKKLPAHAVGYLASMRELRCLSDSGGNRGHMVRFWRDVRRTFREAPDVPDWNSDRARKFYTRWLRIRVKDYAEEYERRRGGLGKFFATDWDFMVLDEAHELRNACKINLDKASTRVYRKSTTPPPVSFRAMCAVQTRFKIALTGTILQNRHSDVVSVCVFLGVAPYDNPGEWKRHLGGRKMKGNAFVARFRDDMMIRRTQKVLSLPPKKIRTRHIEIRPEEHLALCRLMDHLQAIAEERDGLAQQTGLSKEERKDMMREMNAAILVLINRMQQLCNSVHIIRLANERSVLEYERAVARQKATGRSNAVAQTERTIDKSVQALSRTIRDDSTKIKAIAEQLYVSLRNPRTNKIIVFSESKIFLSILGDRIEGGMVAGYSGGVIHYNGSISRKKKEDALREFRAQGGARIMLISSGAGNVGLNLVTANVAIFCEPDWNPQREEQARRRIYRMGQTREVRIYRFICKNTIEAWKKSLQIDKLHTAESVLQDGTATQDLEAHHKKRMLGGEEIRRLFEQFVKYAHESSEQVERDCEKRRKLRKMAQDARMKEWTDEAKAYYEERKRTRRGWRSRKERTDGETTDDWEHPCGKGLPSTDEDEAPPPVCDTSEEEDESESELEDVPGDFIVDEEELFDLSGPASDVPLSSPAPDFPSSHDWALPPTSRQQKASGGSANSRARVKADEKAAERLRSSQLPDDNPSFSIMHGKAGRLAVPANAQRKVAVAPPARPVLPAKILTDPEAYKRDTHAALKQTFADPLQREVIERLLDTLAHIQPQIGIVKTHLRNTFVNTPMWARSQSSYMFTTVMHYVRYFREVALKKLCEDDSRYQQSPEGLSRRRETCAKLVAEGKTPDYYNIRLGLKITPGEARMGIAAAASSASTEITPLSKSSVKRNVVNSISSSGSSTMSKSKAAFVSGLSGTSRKRKVGIHNANGVMPSAVNRQPAGQSIKRLKNSMF